MVLAGTVSGPLGADHRCSGMSQPSTQSVGVALSPEPDSQHGPEASGPQSRWSTVGFESTGCPQGGSWGRDSGRVCGLARATFILMGLGPGLQFHEGLACNTRLPAALGLETGCESGHSPSAARAVDPFECASPERYRRCGAPRSSAGAGWRTLPACSHLAVDAGD